ncbi:MAG: EAL domain-containing protein [Elusimicrobia bacterium]|nr:EAL domain-containing protein [Candidatus Obscuribacterium magneticum]
MDEHPNPLAVSGRQIIDNIHEGIIITDAQGAIQATNPAFCAVTGYTPLEVIGLNPRFLKSGKHDATFYQHMWTAINEKGFWTGEIWDKRKDGSEYIETLTISVLRDKDGQVTHYLGAFFDISHFKKTEENFLHMSFYDPLTNLPNRALFRDRLKLALNQVERSNKLLSVLFLDLDRVNVINESLGHDIGDKLIVQVARRLESTLREGDTIARLGGDEFMLLFPGINHIDDAMKLTEKVLDSLRPPFNIDGQELFITASVGISVYPYDGEDANTLLRNADTAMYRAKGQGRNSYQMFTPEMHVEAHEQLSLGNSFRRALDRNEFVLHYQPQTNIGTGDIVGVEALIRWQHPDFGLLPPSRFIHWAEDTGMIIPIGEWVLRQACQQSKKWQGEGWPHLRISVNLSALQFRQKNLIDLVTRVLKESGLPPDSLELELTETVVMENVGPSISVPHSLRAMGVRFSIDDFGTGYSSLNYLKRFPANTIKMDRAFVSDLSVDSKDAAIATAVIALGHGLDLTVVAEGVETDSQLNILKDLRCDNMQGFLFSHPLPAEDLEGLLKKSHRFQEATLFAFSHPEAGSSPGHSTI